MTHPSFGALPASDGVRFRVLAPEANQLHLVLHGGPAAGEYGMTRHDDGVFDLTVPQVTAGQRYRYRIDGSDPLPDPASRFQPDGVHAASEVVDPSMHAWRDGSWKARHPRDLVIYELHVGTFTDRGTFASAADRLEALVDLGVTAVELMPVADFAGSRNWGYDGVALYAPARAYGRPEDLRAFVDRAHEVGLAVILDVVYNHLGPEGAYLPRFNPKHLTTRHETPWGAAVNLDGPGCRMVRRFLTDNALHWVREYHIDGLRLDATHALIDDNSRHFVAELARTVRASAGRPVVLHAEDHRNLSQIVRDDDEEVWGLDGIWADDFHHVVRTIVAGDRHGYYRDFQGTTHELARTIRQGWLYTGELSEHQRKARGTDPSIVPMRRFIVCVQNHDQIGNRAFGDRLHHRIDAATWRAASVVLLTAPMTPLIFMGQEWAASSPFRYFTDLEPELGRLVTAGRRREFQEFPEFSSPDARERIPDPQAFDTFAVSRLRWEEREAGPHAAVLALYRTLLHLRRTEPALGASDALSGESFAPDAESVVTRRAGDEDEWWIAARLRGAGAVEVGPLAGPPTRAGAWSVVLSTEDPRFAPDTDPPDVQIGADGPVVRFARPGAVVFKVPRQA